MINEKLLNRIKEAENVSEKELYIKEVRVKGLSILKIRDYLIVDGSIVDEDLKNQIYTVYYRTGFLNMSRSINGVMLEKDKLIVAGTSNKIVDKIFKYLNMQKSRKKINVKSYILSFLLFLIAMFALLNVFVVKPAMDITGDYNNLVYLFNDVVEDYNKEVSKVFVDNIEGVPGEMEPLSNVKEGYFPTLISVLKGNLPSKIRKDMDTIKSMITTLNDGIVIIDRIYNPSSQDVEILLRNIDEIDAIKSVTGDNDPNGLLGKEHGYNACVYFTIDGLKIEGILSTDPIVLGTNGGGCIEVYSNVEDAKNRCDYLGQFDNTLLYTGSYAIVGTMVVRTSYVLTEQQQYTLTNYIVQEFTKK